MSARAFLNFGFSRMEISSMLCWAKITPRTCSQFGGIHSHARAGPFCVFSALTGTDHCQMADALPVTPAKEPAVKLFVALGDNKVLVTGFCDRNETSPVLTSSIHGRGLGSRNWPPPISSGIQR